MQSPVLPPISASTARSSSLQFHAAAISSAFELVKSKLLSAYVPATTCTFGAQQRNAIASAKNELRHARVKLDAR